MEAPAGLKGGWLGERNAPTHDASTIALPRRVLG